MRGLGEKSAFESFLSSNGTRPEPPFASRNSKPAPPPPPTCALSARFLHPPRPLPPLSLPRPSRTKFHSRSTHPNSTLHQHVKKKTQRTKNRNTLATRPRSRPTPPASPPTTSSRGSASSARGVLGFSRRSSRRRLCRSVGERGRGVGRMLEKPAKTPHALTERPAPHTHRWCVAQRETE